MVKKYWFVVCLTLVVNMLFAQADFRIIGTPCLNHSLQFTNESDVSADSLLWDFGDGTSSTLNNPTHSYSLINDYTCLLTIYFSGNSDESSKNISIGDIPTAAFTIDTVLYSSFTRIFGDASESLANIATYQWYFGDGTDTLSSTLDASVYKYNEAGTYNVWHKVIDENGCSDTLSQIVSVHDIFRVPNVFTPNGDNKNDNFIVSSNGIDLFEIFIYSRWGNLVFERKGHQQIVWDGRMPNGTLVKPGTYYYVISALDSNTDYQPKNGFITIFY